MHIEESDRLLTKKHEKLLNIALAADIFSWIALGSSAIGGWLKYNSISNIYYSISFQMLFSNKFIAHLQKNPLVGINVGVDILMVVFSWIILFLILRGIALGLRMITETDINYRLNVMGDSENGN